MPLRALLRYLANNEQIVQKIAESYPVRRAAQLCVSIFYRVQNVTRDKMPPIDSVDKQRISSFINRLKKNITDDWQEAKKQINDNDPRMKK